MPEAAKPTLNPLSSLSQRRGERPQTHKAMPHQQLSQNALPHLQQALFERARALPGVRVGPSQISVPGARAFFVDPAMAKLQPDASMVGLEFAHLHPEYDGSLHLMVPRETAQAIVKKAWGEPRPMAELMGGGSGTPIMVYGPRDEGELEVVWSILQASHAFAYGQLGAEEGDGV